MRSGDQSPHELWMSHELLLPDLSLGKKPPTSHIASSHIKVCSCTICLSPSLDIQLQSKDCPAGRGGSEIGCGKDASPQKSKGVLLGHRLPLVHEEHERRSKKGELGHYLPINILLDT